MKTVFILFLAISLCMPAYAASGHFALESEEQVMQHEGMAEHDCCEHGSDQQDMECHSQDSGCCDGACADCSNTASQTSMALFDDTHLIILLQGTQTQAVVPFIPASPLHSDIIPPKA